MKNYFKNHYYIIKSQITNPPLPAKEKKGGKSGEGKTLWKEQNRNASKKTEAPNVYSQWLEEIEMNWTLTWEPGKFS